MKSTLPRSDRARDRQMSVSPNHWVDGVLGGRRTVLLNRAIECWATQLGKLTQEVAPLFNGNDWAFLLDALAGRASEFSPMTRDAGAMLAQAVGDADATRGIGQTHFGNRHRSRVEDVRLKLDRLSYAHAWAVLWALDYGAGLDPESQASEEWWTLAHRTQGG